MMSYKRFIPSHAPTGAEVASDFPPLMFAGHRKSEHGRQKAALDAFAAPEPLPIGLVAGAQWCRCSDSIHP
jgi:hypothetical protein